jgi:HSP20 family protein
MSVLSRFNPFKASTSMAPIADFDDLFRALTTRPFSRDNEPAPEMRLDVNETETAYQVKADIPGVSKDDISVSVDGKVVSINAEVKRESEKQDGNSLCTERYYGRVYRAFSVANDIDSTKVEARYDNGVLNLSLPKKPNGQLHKITVN